MNRPDHEIDAYLEGTLTAEQASAIDAWVIADSANAAAFLHLVRTHQTLGLVGKERQLARDAQQASAQDLDPVTLHSLAQMEAAAQPLSFSEVDQPFAFESAQRSSQNKKDVTLGQAFDDFRWAAGKIAVRLIRSPYGIASAIAAMLLIGFVLLSPFSSNESTEQEFADNTPIKPAESAPPILRDHPVATLTATHNAQWAPAGGASAPPRPLTPGTQLHPNDRLTLTQGFAEITTQRGAVALIAAPATVELIDNPNALHLHTGKLVGLCQSESSKGFVVKTDQADITDLGTEFGVGVEHAGPVRVRVYQGHVGVAANAEQADRHSLFAGDMVQIEAGQVQRVGYDRSFDFRRQLRAPLAVAPALSGQVRWLSTPPAVAQRFEDSNNAYLFLERAGVTVPKGTDLTAETPELIVNQPEPVFLQDTRVDSYFVFYSPQSEYLIGLEGKIVFDRPILGVIVEDNLFEKTDGLFAYDGTEYASAKGHRGFEGGDVVEIAPDRMSLKFKVGAVATDSFRILVASNEKEDAPSPH